MEHQFKRHLLSHLWLTLHEAKIKTATLYSDDLSDCCNRSISKVDNHHLGEWGFGMRCRLSESEGMVLGRNMRSSGLGCWNMNPPSLAAGWVA